MEGDSIPASDVEAGALASGSYSIDGALAVDAISECSADSGVMVDYVLTYGR